MVRHWSKLLRKLVESLFLEVFKRNLDMALGDMVIRSKKARGLGTHWKHSEAIREGLGEIRQGLLGLQEFLQFRGYMARFLFCMGQQQAGRRSFHFSLKLFSQNCHTYTASPGFPALFQPDGVLRASPQSNNPQVHWRGSTRLSFHQELDFGAWLTTSTAACPAIHHLERAN